MLQAASAAQLTGSVFSAGDAASTAQVRTIRGRVVDALTGTGIARALVNLNARQVLTDAQGHFEFKQFTDSTATAAVMRPGYSTTADGAMPAQQRRIADLDQPIELKLYPDALITGIVSGSDGWPLPQVQVILRRSNTTGQGQRWSNSGFSMTNTRGEYRITTPGGRFRVGVSYSMRVPGIGLAASPVTYPEAAANGPGGYFTLNPGEERHIDLRSHTGESYPVLLHVDQAEGRSGVRFSVSTQNGDSFQPAFAPTVTPGEYRLQLPSGSFTIRAHVDTREESLDGTARVTIPGHAVSGVELHLAPATSLPVEVHAGAISATSNDRLSDPPSTVDARQLNLSLRNDTGDVSSELGNGIPLHQGDNKSWDFRVPAGRYHLQGTSSSAWYVVAASAGATDLLVGELVVGPGTAGQTIRLDVSNQRGQVKGHVTLVPGATGAWIYLMPLQPSLSMPAPLVTTDGSFTAWLPVGSYQAIALPGPLQQDLSDPGVVTHLSAGAKTISVASGAETLLELQLEHAPQVER